MAQRADGVVVNRGRVFRAEPRRPIHTLALRDFANVQFAQAGPGPDSELRCTFGGTVLHLASTPPSLQTDSVNPQGITKGHLSSGNRGARLDRLTFSLEQVRQPKLGDAENIRLERPANKLAADPRPRKIYARWNVTNKIGNRAVCPL